MTFLAKYIYLFLAAIICSFSTGGAMEEKGSYESSNIDTQDVLESSFFISPEYANLIEFVVEINLCILLSSCEMPNLSQIVYDYIMKNVTEKSLLKRDFFFLLDRVKEGFNPNFWSDDEYEKIANHLSFIKNESLLHVIKSLKLNFNFSDKTVDKILQLGGPREYIKKKCEQERATTDSKRQEKMEKDGENELFEFESEELQMAYYALISDCTLSSDSYSSLINDTMKGYKATRADTNVDKDELKENTELLKNAIVDVISRNREYLSDEDFNEIITMVSYGASPEFFMNDKGMTVMQYILTYGCPHLKTLFISLFPDLANSCKTTTTSTTTTTTTSEDIKEEKLENT